MPPRGTRPGQIQVGGFIRKTLDRLDGGDGAVEDSRMSEHGMHPRRHRAGIRRTRTQQEGGQAIVEAIALRRNRAIARRRAIVRRIAALPPSEGVAQSPPHRQQCWGDSGCDGLIVPCGQIGLSVEQALDADAPGCRRIQLPAAVSGGSAGRLEKFAGDEFRSLWFDSGNQAMVKMKPER